MMKRIRAFFLGVVFLLASCIASAGPATKSEAELECVNYTFAFVQQYLALREQGATPQELIAALRGRPALVARARRFIEAESRGDIEAAKAAVTEIIDACVQDLIHPKVEA